MALTIYAINQWHSPSVSHGYEPVAHFTDRTVAERYAEKCTAKANAENWEYCGTPLTYEVEEITVDDPATMSALEKMPV